MCIALKAFYLSSPSFSSAADWQFGFGYHMHGTSMGELSIEGLSDSSWTTLWDLSGDQGVDWLQADVTIPSAMSQLRFVAVTGTDSSSDIAIDDLGMQLASQSYSFFVSFLPS